MEQAELDLREMISMLRRRLWLLLALPAMAAVVAGLLSVYIIDPVYSASTTLWVIKDGGSAQLNYNDLMLNRNLTKTYAEVAQSRSVMTRVIKDLGLTGVKVTDLQNSLSVTPVKDTEILSFTVENTDPAMAARLADAIAASFQTEIRSYMKVENVVVVDHAQAPEGPIKPRKTMNVAIAFVLGAMAAVGLAFLLEYLDTSIKTPEDVAAHVGLPVLGVIPLIDLEAEPQPTARVGRRHRSSTKQAGVL